MKLPGRQTTGRSSRRLMDVVMEDIQRTGVTEGYARQGEIGDEGKRFTMATLKGSSQKKKC